MVVPSLSLTSLMVKFFLCVSEVHATAKAVIEVLLMFQIGSFIPVAQRSSAAMLVIGTTLTTYSKVECLHRC